MSKITYDEYLKLARNPETEDEVLLSYSLIERGEGGFDFTFKADPEKVELTVEDIKYESAMQMGNGLARYRRQAKFRLQKLAGSNLPVLVSEGDSWFQFPLLIREVIDQLKDDYLIWSIGAAGDTAQNIVYGRKIKGETEYLKALIDNKEDVQGFLLSAAGNDIIGQDPSTQKPVLFDILKDFNGDKSDIEGHINVDLLNQKLDFLQNAYTTVINEVRSKSEFKNLPVFIHGYDYAFPYPWGDDDPRNPLHADKNEWLGKPLDQRKIYDNNQRRDIIKFLIDKLYDMLSKISSNSQKTGVWLIDCRGAMPDVHDWIDEIHGTSQGFKKVTTRFKNVLEQAI